MDSNSLHTEELEDWWLRSLEGDTHAFHNIHRELFGGLYHYALKLLQDGELANDAVQELFVKLWVKRGSIGVLKQVKPYFFTALRRQALNQLRNHRLRQLRLNGLPGPGIDFSPARMVVKYEEYRSRHSTIAHLLIDLH